MIYHYKRNDQRWRLSRHGARLARSSSDLQLMTLFKQPFALPPADILTLRHTTWCSGNPDCPPHHHSTYSKGKNLVCVSTPKREAKNAEIYAHCFNHNNLCIWQLCSPSHPTPGCVYAHCPPYITEGGPWESSRTIHLPVDLTVSPTAEECAPNP